MCLHINTVLFIYTPFSIAIFEICVTKKTISRAHGHRRCSPTGFPGQLAQGVNMCVRECVMCERKGTAKESVRSESDSKCNMERDREWDSEWKR